MNAQTDEVELATPNAANESTVLRAPRSRWHAVWRAMKQAPPTAWFGLIVIVLYTLIAIFAPWIAPHGESEVVGSQYEPWDERLFGTDQLGRDLLSRLIYGA